MTCPKLLPTGAKTAEKRRIELSNPEYMGKYRAYVTIVREYKKYPKIKPVNNQIRFFPDGLESIVDIDKIFNYGLLVLEKKKQIIDFCYFS